MKLKVKHLLSQCLFLLLMLGMSSFATAQTVTGKVTEAGTGEGLIGASVLVKGTTTGALTDAEGNYSVNTEGGTILVFSYTGFSTKEVTIDGQTTINIALEEGITTGELVVVGYGTAKKSDLTGSNVNVDAKDFNKGVLTAPDQLIQGKVAGVQIINNSGQPGGGTTVRIRGNSSVRSGNQPLYVVDGVPLDGRSARPGGTGDANIGSTADANPLNFINPNDIASINVLKDASATAIYGSRGANGVVIITTKKGKSGAPSIDFSTSFGSSSILKKYDVLTGDEYRSALTAYGLTSGDGGGSVDAMDAILQDGTTQNYNFSVGGGSENGSYRVSGGYLNANGIVQESGLQKYTGSVRGNFKFIDGKVGLDYNLLAAQIDEDIAPIGTNSGFTGSLIGQALQWNPTVPLTTAGEFTNSNNNPLVGATTINPLAMNAAYSDRSQVTNILGSISPYVNLAEGLTYRFLYSINRQVGERRTSFASWINIENIEGRGLAGAQFESLTTQQFTHTLSYNKSVSESIDMNAVVGYEYQSYNKKGFGASARDFITDELDLTNVLGSGNQNSFGMYSFADPSSELQSYFGRVNLNINSQFLVTATVRADGSSKFGDNNKYGVFPSVAAAWNMHEAGFLPDAINSLKFRVGWGQTGNQEFPAGSAQARYGLGNGGTLALENVANPDLKWETSSTFNVGFDFIIANMLSGSVEYFNKNTTDLLFNFATIQPAPAGRYWVNLPGNVTNSGVELALSAFLIDNSDMSLSIGGNVAFLKNVLNDYTGPNVLTGPLFGQGISGTTVQRLESGQPLNSFYVREHLSIDDQGQSTFTDDGNSFFFLGNPNATSIYGINVEFTASDFFASMNFNGAGGHQIYNNTANTVIPIGNLGSRNVDANLINGVSVQESTANAIKASSRYLEDGTYMKLANMTLGYTIGDLGNYVKNVRISLTGQNLLVFTNYSGFDPEVNTVNDVDGVPSFGIEYIPYPSARSILFGINFSF